MNRKSVTTVLCAAAALCARADSSADNAMQDPAPLHHVRVAKWRGDAKGAVSFYYDDGTDSSFDFVRPVLVKYHVPGTFYICAGWFKGEDDPKLSRWSCARDFPEIVLGDHTLRHCGVTNVENFVSEIEANGSILRRISGLPANAPLSFALPGGVQWKITPQEQEKALSDHFEHLRHDFGTNIGGDGHGQFTMSDFDKAVKALDRAEVEGSWQSLLFHGVGGDWLRYPAADHEMLIRETASRVAQGRLWAGAETEVLRYSQARDVAKIVDSADSSDAGDSYSFRLTLADGAPRDVSLTLVADVPADWVSVVVEDGSSAPSKRPVFGGKVTFDAPPCVAGFVDITIRKDQ